MFKVIIAGSRSFDNYEVLKKAMNQLLNQWAKDKDEIIVISGTARGTDQLGERYAEEKGYQVMRFPAKWERYGLSAEIIRNQQMANVADACAVFWDGQSRDSKHMIRIAQKFGLKVTVFDFEGNRTDLCQNDSRQEKRKKKTPPSNI